MIYWINWYGFVQGGNYGNQYTVANEKLFNLPNLNSPSTQKELAESYGITQQTMNNYIRMASMIPELKWLMDTVIVTDEVIFGGGIFINYKTYK